MDENLSIMSSEDLLNAYRDEIVLSCAQTSMFLSFRSLERYRKRDALYSELLRRLRLVEPPKFT